MNKKTIAQFKQQLVDLKAELQVMQQEHEQASATVELDQTKVGRLSRMDAMQMQQMALEAVRRRQQQLLAVDVALRRIGSGEYGYCLICEEEIATARLKANPACTHCITCAD